MKAPEKWKQVEELFNAALELEPAARDSFLAEACAGDQELRREVESLLAYENQTAGFIQKPALEVAANALAADAHKADQPKTISRQIGAYRIIEPLGKGGMGEVHLAFDPRLGRKVAIKLLPAEFTADAERVRRFEQEARAASALNHPNIITIHEIGEENGAHYIVTEFIDGRTLRERMTSETLALDAALDVAIQTASALAVAHEAGIIHRDIKPENLMVRADGLVKVLDFGLAKLAERPVSAVDSEASTLNKMETASGVVMGTPQYMSPEQARGLKIDERTDIFSLGAMLYEMSAGRKPFEGETISDVIAEILKTEPVPLADHRPGLPAELQRIVSKALAKEPAGRYQAAKELEQDLRTLKRELELDPRLIGTDADEGRKGAGYLISRLRRYQRSALLTLAALIVTAAVIALSFRDTNRINSIAVLPLANASADPNVEYLSDGLTETIINSLSQMPKLRVIARSTVFSYKGKEVDPRKVGQELKVQAALIWNMRQQDDTLTIRAELVNTADGTRLWGEEYHRKLDDILVLQEEIARQISNRLSLKLTGEEQQQVVKRHTSNIEAYRLYIKGRYFWNQRGDLEKLKKSEEYFLQAIEKDPKYASAYAGLADSYIALNEQGALPAQEANQRAKTAASKALEIDGTLAEAHASSAFLSLIFDWDLPAAERGFKRAIELNQNYVTAHHWYGVYLLSRGRLDEAIAETKTAQEFDPLALYANSNFLCRTLYFARRYDQAIAQCRESIALNPNSPAQYTFLGQAYTEKGMHAEAVAALQQARTLAPHRPEMAAALGYSYAVSGRRDEAQQVLDELKGKPLRKDMAYCIALIYAGLGEREQAFEWLQRSYQNRDIYMILRLNVEPKFDALRSDPRFIDLLRSVGLLVAK